MSDKSNKTITVSELKESIISRLLALAPRLDKFDRMKIADALKIDLVTVNRYLDERYLKKLKLFEVPEKVIEEANRILEAKQPAPATAQNSHPKS